MSGKHSKKKSKQRHQQRPKAGGAHKRSDQNSKPSHEPHSRGGFTFKDRSGKVHSIGTGRVIDHGGKTAEVKSGGPKIIRPEGKRSEGRLRRPEGKFQSRSHQERRPDRSSFQKKPKNLTTLKANIDKHRDGFAFLLFENKDYEDAFLNPREAERFFHGDRVEVSMSEEGEVFDIKVLAHRFREIVGRFYPIGKNGRVVYERKRAKEEIPCRGETKGAKSRDWVRAKMIFNDHNPDDLACEVLEIYGQELPASADLKMVAAEYNLIEEHSAEAKAQAEQCKLDLEDPHRVDLRHVPFITIDGETARDFDDAVFVERDKGGFILWVAIADVSQYVIENTVLDQEAYERATSVYFPERAFHMLPRALSENLCSLKPKEPRLTMVAKMFFSKDGKRTSVEVMNAIIESKRRATYNEIQAEFEKNRENQSWEFLPHFDLYFKIRRARANRGSIDFDLPEAEIRVDPQGEPISIKHRPRHDAHRLIEEFMIAANEAVTDYAVDRGYPFVFRIHDEPDVKKLLKFQDLCSNSGIEFNLDRKNLLQSLADVIKVIADHPAANLLNTALLRSMPQAKYMAVNQGHFGLASTGYTHFTSPIRRYPDLMVHRILKMVLENERNKSKLAGSDKEELLKKLEEQTEHCSYRERVATDAERESIKLKQVRILLKEVGNEFEGKINGIVDSGFFVGLNDPFVEGLVPKDTLNDDVYEFIEERMVMVGKRKKRTFKIGQLVKIRVDLVDIDLRLVNFGLVEVLPAKTAE